MEHQEENKLTALALVEVNSIQAGLADLRQKYGDVVFDVGTTKGMDEAKKARAAVREPRYALERIRKAKIAELRAAQMDLNTHADDIEKEIRKIEDPIDRQIKAEEERKEQERQAAQKAEQERVDKIRQRIEKMVNLPAQMISQDKSSYEVQQTLEYLSTIDLSEGDFQEFHAEALHTRNVMCEELSKLVAKVKQRELEAAAAAAARAAIEAKDREIAELKARLAALEKPAEQPVAEPVVSTMEIVATPGKSGKLDLTMSTYKGEPIDPATESWSALEAAAAMPTEIADAADRLFTDEVPAPDRVVNAVALHFGVTEERARDYIINAAEQLVFGG